LGANNTGRHTVDVTIPINTALSNAIQITFTDIVGFYMPAAWTAADIGFEVSHDGVTYYIVSDSAGALVTIPVAADDFITLPDGFVQGNKWCRVRSQNGGTGAAVNQLAARTIKLVKRDLR
jgi:hypothetical protein